MLDSINGDCSDDTFYMVSTMLRSDPELTEVATSLQDCKLWRIRDGSLQIAFETRNQVDNFVMILNRQLGKFVGCVIESFYSSANKCFNMEFVTRRWRLDLGYLNPKPEVTGDYWFMNNCIGFEAEAHNHAIPPLDIGVRKQIDNILKRSFQSED